MQHPGLHVRVFLFFNERFVEEARPAVENILVNFDLGVARKSKSPHDVSGHPTIAFTLFPPTPAAIGMLKIVKAIETGFDHLIEFLQILFAIGMSSSSRAGFNSTKNAAHDVFRLQP